MAKTQVTLTIDEDIKKQFQALAKKLGSNMSTLTNMYYTQVVSTGKVEYETDNEPVEIGFIGYDELSMDDKKIVDDINSRDIESFINV
ncbi:hypothetical protein LR010_00590 [Candidatus Gracilibacteria bacterium]|nr:hypothetical protein [Candidatus Gracilibacteria bacterium]